MSNKLMRSAALILICMGLGACGSLTTTTQSDYHIYANLKRQNTYCESLPRVYGGLAYDFCRLNANPGTIHSDLFLGFYLLDGAASAIVDTVLLPYTGYQQYRVGSLNLNSSPESY